jgi:type IV secretion system protein VirB10
MLGFILLAVLLQDPPVQTPADTESKPQPLIVAPVSNRVEGLLPKGTLMLVSLVNRVSTKNITEGSGVYARTIVPISDGTKVVIPSGTMVMGKVVAAERGGRIKGKASLVISFQTLMFDSGLTIPIYASIGTSDTGVRKGETGLEAEPGTEAEDVAVGAARGAAGGAIVGAFSSVGVGRAVGIGAGAGAGASLAEALIRRGPDLTLDRGTVIELVLDQPVQF